MRYILILILFNATFLKGQQLEVLGHIKEGVSMIEYLRGCNALKIDAAKLNELTNELSSLHLKPSSDDTLRIANDSLKFVKSSSIHLYKSDDNLFSLYIEECQDKAELNKRWRIVQPKQRMFWGYSHYYFKFDSLQNVSLNATFGSKYNLINIQKRLPFYAINYDDISSSQWKLIDEANTSILNALKILANHLTSDSDKIYFPANGSLYHRVFTSTERLSGFVNFWTEVKYNFAFFDQVPDLDWDQVLLEYLPRIQVDQSNFDYYKLLQELCAKLNDGHTNIYPPFDLRPNYYYPNVELSVFDDGIFVVNSSEKYRDLLPLGSKITMVNGTNISEYLQHELYPFISSSTEYIKKNMAVRNLLEISTNTDMHIEFITPTGKQGNYSFKNEVEDTMSWIIESKRWYPVEFEMLESNIAYLKINTFNTDVVVDEFKKWTDSIRIAKKLIIDLRQNGGGNSNYAYEILKYFADKPFLTSKWMTREHKAAYKAWGKDLDEPAANEWEEESIATFKGNKWIISPPDTIEPNDDQHISIPIIILIGNNTASAAEDFLVSAETMGLTETVGDYTYGSTGQPLHFRLPGGGTGRICTKKDVFPDGKEFVGYGIKPKHLVKPTINDVLNERDEVLEYAIKLAF